MEKGSELVSNTNQFKMRASDGKMRLTDTLDTEGIFRLIESVPSPKAEPFKLWLAKLGKERIDEVFDPSKGIDQMMDDLLQSHNARTMLANSEFLIMLNQAYTDRLELAKLLSISNNQLDYITNVDAGEGLLKVGSSLVPFKNEFPKDTKLYKLMSTKPGENK